MFVLLDQDWVGVEADPPDRNFQSPAWGSSSTSGGLNPANPPTNRTLVIANDTDCCVQICAENFSLVDNNVGNVVIVVRQILVVFIM